MGRQDGGITPEWQRRGGGYAGFGGINPVSPRPRWRTRVWDVSVEGRRAFDTPAGDRGDGRHKLVCNRRHRDSYGRPALIQRVVTQSTLDRVCTAAAVAGRRRVTFDDFR